MTKLSGIAWIFNSILNFTVSFGNCWNYDETLKPQKMPKYACGLEEGQKAESDNEQARLWLCNITWQDIPLVYPTCCM